MATNSPNVIATGASILKIITCDVYYDFKCFSHKNENRGTEFAP